MTNIKKCNQCDYLWEAKPETTPKQCPRCKRYDYACKKKKVSPTALETLNNTKLNT